MVDSNTSYVIAIGILSSVIVVMLIVIVILSIVLMRKNTGKVNE